MLALSTYFISLAVYLNLEKICHTLAGGSQIIIKAPKNKQGYTSEYSSELQLPSCLWLVNFCQKDHAWAIKCPYLAYLC